MKKRRKPCKRLTKSQGYYIKQANKKQETGNMNLNMDLLIKQWSESGLLPNLEKNIARITKEAKNFFGGIDRIASDLVSSKNDMSTFFNTNPKGRRKTYPKNKYKKGSKKGMSNIRNWRSGVTTGNNNPAYQYRNVAGTNLYISDTDSTATATNGTSIRDDRRLTKRERKALRKAEKAKFNVSTKPTTKNWEAERKKSAPVAYCIKSKDNYKDYLLYSSSKELLECILRRIGVYSTTIYAVYYLPKEIELKHFVDRVENRRTIIGALNNRDKETQES